MPGEPVGGQVQAVEALRGSPLFTEVRRGDLEDFALGGRSRRYRAGAFVFSAGDPSDQVCCVVEGMVQLSSCSADGRTQLHAVIGPGQVFGELGVLAGVLRTHSAECLSDSVIWEIDAPAFATFAHSEPSVAEALLQALARQVLAHEGLIEDLLFLDLKARVAKRLLALVSSSWDAPPPDGTPLPWELTQTTLAALCGGSREQVNRILAELARRGMVARSGRRYVLCDVRGLRRLAGIPL